METRGRRGSRGSVETAARETAAAPAPAAAAPEAAPPSPDESAVPQAIEAAAEAATVAPEAAPSSPDGSAVPQAAEDPAAAGGDSLTALAVAEAALARVPESSGEPVSGGPAASSTAGNFCALDRDSLAALAKSQAALARGMTALSFEIAGLALSEFDAASRAATRLLAVRTLSDAMALQIDYARRSLDTALAGMTRLSQLGVKLAADAAEPLVAQFGRNWMKAMRRAG